MSFTQTVQQREQPARPARPARALGLNRVFHCLLQNKGAGAPPEREQTRFVSSHLLQTRLVSLMFSVNVNLHIRNDCVDSAL